MIKEVAVNIVATVFIKASELKLYNIVTGEEKTLDKIPNLTIQDTELSDPNWILASSINAMKNGQCEYEEIKFEDVTQSP